MIGDGPCADRGDDAAAQDVMIGILTAVKKDQAVFGMAETGKGIDRDWRVDDLVLDRHDHLDRAADISRVQPVHLELLNAQLDLESGYRFIRFDKLNGYLFREVCTRMIIVSAVGIVNCLWGKPRFVAGPASGRRAAPFAL